MGLDLSLGLSSGSGLESKAQSSRNVEFESFKVREFSRGSNVDVREMKSSRNWRSKLEIRELQRWKLKRKGDPRMRDRPRLEIRVCVVFPAGGSRSRVELLLVVPLPRD